MEGLGSRSECWFLGLWGFGFLGLKKIGQNTKTLKLAKVGLTKVSQHIKTLKLAKKLAKVGLARLFLPSHIWVPVFFPLAILAFFFSKNKKMKKQSMEEQTPEGWGPEKWGAPKGGEPKI